MSYSAPVYSSEFFLVPGCHSSVCSFIASICERLQQGRTFHKSYYIQVAQSVRHCLAPCLKLSSQFGTKHRVLQQNGRDWGRQRCHLRALGGEFTTRTDVVAELHRSREIICRPPMWEQLPPWIPLCAGLTTRQTAPFPQDLEASCSSSETRVFCMAEQSRGVAVHYLIFIYKFGILDTGSNSLH